MAVTSIWRVKGWLGKVVIYIENPDKTENPAFYEKRDLADRQSQGLDDVMPIVEVTPHFMTNEDAKRVATVLFGNANFYDVEPSNALLFSKDEILKKIARWTPYGSAEGDAKDEIMARITNKFIKDYTLMLETAPIENPHKPCQWEFKKETYYNYPSAKADTMNTDDDNDQIQAAVTVGDIPYIYNVSTRDKSDFKLNNIYAKPYDGPSPADIDYSIFRMQLCNTDSPNESVLEDLKLKAAAMLDQMDLGEWVIDKCNVEELQNLSTTNYIVNINAVPVFGQVACLRRPQINNLNSSKVYASNYYLTDVQFQFSADGNLVYFRMFSPVDIKEIVNDNVATLDMDQLFERAKEFFIHSDYYEYGYGNSIDLSSEELKCIVEINQIEYGLTRVKVPNTDESYYYLPAISFSGKSEYCGAESNNVYYAEDNNRVLLILNAIDGSVINTTNE